MEAARRRELVQSFEGLRVLVIGDAILDRYWWGEVHRVSPEAPVPVLRKRGVTLRPGGAANAAANLRAMGAQVELVGCVGEDEGGRQLLAELARYGVQADGMLRDANRPTTTKTRLIAQHQQLLRVDEEENWPLGEGASRTVVERVRGRLRGGLDAVVISDYAKGMVTPEWLSPVLEAAEGAGVRTFIDPKGQDLARYRGASYLKPNRLELSLLAGMSVAAHEDALRAGRSVVERLGGRTRLLVTEGADGMTLLRPDGTIERVLSAPQQVFDVTGAGDTVLAAFALGVVAGAAEREAMELAARAAEIAIGIVGAAIVRRDMLAKTETAT